MNRYIKAGSIVAIPGVIALPFVWAICGVGYFVNMQIDPSSSGMFFYYWALLFTIFYSLLAITGFILGVCEEYRNNENVKGVKEW